MGAFKEPHGGVLKDLYLDTAAAEEEKKKALNYPSWDFDGSPAMRHRAIAQWRVFAVGRISDAR